MSLFAGNKWSLGKLVLMILIVIILFDLIAAAVKYFAAASTTAVSYATSIVGNQTMIYTNFNSWAIVILDWFAKMLSTPIAIAVLIFLGFIIIALEMRW